MMEFAPEDEAVIRELTKAMRDSTKFGLPADKPPELYGILDYIKMIKMLPSLMFFRKWGKISQVDYARRVKNSFLRKVLSSLSPAGELADCPSFFIPWVVACLNQKNGGYVIGGALALASYIQKRYLDLGGELHLKARVEKVLVENDKAVGLRLADGTEYRGDIVISAADGHTTIFDMLDGKYIDDRIRGYYDNLPLYPPFLFIGLGVARKFDDMPSSIYPLTFPLEKPVTIADKEHKTLSVLIYNFDPTLAPKGKTVLNVRFNSDYDYWERLYKEPERYKAEKEQIADTVVALLDKRFPGLGRLR